MGSQQEALDELNAVTVEIRSLGATTENTVRRSAALLEMHACACMDGNMKEADSLRMQIQSAVDTILDAHARSADLDRKSKKAIAELTKLR